MKLCDFRGTQLSRDVSQPTRRSRYEAFAQQRQLARVRFHNKAFVANAAHRRERNVRAALSSVLQLELGAKQYFVDAEQVERSSKTRGCKGARNAATYINGSPIDCPMQPKLHGQKRWGRRQQIIVPCSQPPHRSCAICRSPGATPYPVSSRSFAVNVPGIIIHRCPSLPIVV